MQGIDKENYEAIARAFIGMSGGKGFMIAKRPKKFTVEYTLEPTLMEWGAWLAWRKKKELPIKFMERNGYYMVPTRWPHELDADQLQAEDTMAGNRYFDEFVKQQNKREITLSPTHRRAFIANALKGFPRGRNYQKLEPKPERPATDEELVEKLDKIFSNPIKPSEELKRMWRDGSEFQGQ